MAILIRYYSTSISPRQMSTAVSNHGPCLDGSCLFTCAYAKCSSSCHARRAASHSRFMLKRYRSDGLFFPCFIEPGPMGPPILQDVKSRMMLVTWQQPPKCNGVISHYNLYQHGHLYLRMPGNVTNATVLDLLPYTAYKFQVEACTAAGCSLSPESQTAWTLPGAPEGIPSPELFSDTPTSVIISWQPPSHPNGLVANFTIERRVKGKEEVVSLATLPGNHSMRYVDNTPALSPWTNYEYRILVHTLNGGTNSSAWAEVTTRPSRPAGVQPPAVRVLGPDAAKVRA